MLASLIDTICGRHSSSRSLARALLLLRPDSVFSPDLTVSALALLDDTLYVGGTFELVGGERHRGLAAIDVETAAVKSEFRADLDPIKNLNNDGINFGSPNSIFAIGERLYVGGNLPSVNGRKTRNLAAFDRRTGVLDTQWNATTSDTVSALFATPHGVFVGGLFNSVNGRSRINLAAIDVRGRVTDWAPTTENVHPDNPYYLFPRGVVRALAKREDTIYIGGDFTSISAAFHVGGPRVRSDRRGLAAVDTKGLLVDWGPPVVPGRSSYSVFAIAVQDAKVFVAGSFDKVGEFWRSRIAAIDAVSGEVLPWNPGIEGSAFALATTPTTVYAVGTLQLAHGEPRTFGAAFDARTGDLLPWHVEGPLGGYYSREPRTLAVYHSTVFVGGVIEGGAEGFGETGLIAVDATTGDYLPSWPVRLGDFEDTHYPRVNAVAVWDDTLYVAGNFRTGNGASRTGVAAFDARTGALQPWNPRVEGGEVLSLEVDDSGASIGGSFDQVQSGRYWSPQSGYAEFPRRETVP